MSFELDLASRYYQRIASNLAGIPGTLLYLDDFAMHDLSLPFHIRSCQKDLGAFDGARFICTIVIY